MSKSFFQLFNVWSSRRSSGKPFSPFSITVAALQLASALQGLALQNFLAKTLMPASFGAIEALH